MKIYCAHAISGRSKSEIVDYYKKVVNELREQGYDVYHPIVEVNYIRNDISEKDQPKVISPTVTNHSIKERDKWMVRQCDVIFCDLTGTNKVSIGCVAEIAWADAWGKHVVVAMEKDNLHRHAFIEEIATVVFDTYDNSMDYLDDLIKRKI